MVDFARSLFGFGGFHGNNRGTDNAASQAPSGSSTTATTNTMASGSVFAPGKSTDHYYPQSGFQRDPSGDTQSGDISSNNAHAGGDYGHSQNSSRPEASVKIGGAIRHSDESGNSGDAVLDENTLPLKGKLTVRIMEARNLVTKPGCRPYVVCTFATSEYISHGFSGNSDSQSSNSVAGGIAIPSRNQSRQSSNLALYKLGSEAKHTNYESKNHSSNSASNPLWEEEAQFDVTDDKSVLSITIYDANNEDDFLGQARFKPNLNRCSDSWIQLQSRLPGEHVGGEVRVSLKYEKVFKQHFGPEDFEVLRLVGKGTFGRVFQVRKKDTHQIYAMKVLSKRAIVQKREIAHTIGERNILVRTASADSSFIVGLKFSFQTPSDLYLVTDYMSGGELFWHLQKEGRFQEDRAKFYIAELIVALGHLHENGIVYRDLKPENILLDANGHVALCDFGLSKANLDDGTTNTFCGTTEYLAPEVLLDDQGYTKMVDFWSLGVLVFEMCCGWSPFYAEDNQQMYKNIAFGKVRFPKDALSAEGRNFVKGLLNRNPRHRLGATNDAAELKEHPFFADVNWDLLVAKKIPPPFKPHVASETDTSNFDPEFTQTSTSALNKSMYPTSGTPLSPGIQANFQGFTYVDASLMDEPSRNRGNVSASYRPRPTQGRHKDDDIDLYDDDDINLSKSYYNESGLGQKYGEVKMDEAGERDMQMEDDDVQMQDEDDDEHDFVSGQGFEM